ncbi:C2H2-type zinc finger transcription factor [Rhizophagus irregularis DAOM 181602=DAOM 197198]|nr:C2H2-type zinc finger transcription factor [Rhizophagus irregularis DAOM 181602=DAOM 197198]
MNSKRRMDQSDDEGPHHSRDKFTSERRNSVDRRDIRDRDLRERDRERDREVRDFRDRDRDRDRNRDRGNYVDRRKRDSNSSPEDRNNDRRSKRRRSISPDPRRQPSDGGDHYIPNYDKDGYTPAPRYVGRPGDIRFPPPGFPVMPIGFSVGPNPQILPPGAPMMPMDWSGPRQETPKDPDQLDFLVTFKYYSEFMQHSNPKNRLSDEELHKKYNEYKEAFALKQLKTFFESHKKEEWFLEKYHPKYIQERAIVTKELKKDLYKQFISDLKEGLLDKINNDASEDSVKQEDGVKVETKDPDEDSNRLFIKSVSPNISRQKIEEMCKTIEGFQYLALSEPNPQKKFHRLGWIVFKEGTDMDSAYDKLNEQKIDEFVFYLARHKNQTGPVRNRITPDVASSIERLKKDLNQIQKLCDKLDNDIDGGFEGSTEIRTRLAQFDNSQDRDEADDVKRLLDFHIEYLRRTHMFCYYCGSESDSVEELARKCPGRHLRGVLGGEGKTSVNKNKEKQVNSTQWLKTLDHKIAYKTEPWKFENEIEKHGGISLQKVLEKFYQEHVVEVDPQRKFKCKLCGKLFKGSDFVKKHIDYKHHETVEITSNDTKFFNNYVLDPNHLLPTTPPNPTAALNVPQNVTPIPTNPFSVMTNAPPPPFMGFNFPIVGAAAGTPHDQIPRIGFDAREDGRERGQKNSRKQLSRTRPNESSDPRQVKSYVDLDAPAEELDIHCQNFIECLTD